MGRPDVRNNRSAFTSQWEKKQQALSSQEEGNLIPRQVPVHMNITGHEVGGIRFTLERNTESMADRTVGTITPGQIGGAHRLLSTICVTKLGAHAVGVLLER